MELRSTSRFPIKNRTERIETVLKTVLVKGPAGAKAYKRSLISSKPKFRLVLS